MNQNLYFKTNEFGSAKELASYVHSELQKLNYAAKNPIDSDYMFSIEIEIDGVKLDIYLGKNDEETDIPLWQIWPEQRISLFKRIFGNADKSAETRVKSELETIISKIKSVSDVEWGI
ncbi:hypothetical protein HR45_05000 [Shewanella mangrovi]|uniref:Uncharacterized protein n=1 Tax=Shewanella mangrovi TaxID=1515746 RepID=A0A094LUA1_9GAMM|nr:hypothetical protein [Shewanella mangrovi]KFZ38773.1 hypothetical protein HR45_05000 [Shewanella mangrovi]